MPSTARAGKGKTVKAWAILDDTGQISDGTGFGDVPVYKTKRAAQRSRHPDSDERVVAVEVRILSEGTR